MQVARWSAEWGSGQRGGIRHGDPMERWIRPGRWRSTALERIFLRGVDGSERTDKVASGEATSVCPRMPHESITVFTKNITVGKIFFQIDGRASAQTCGRMACPDATPEPPPSRDCGKNGSPTHAQQQKAWGPPNPLWSFTCLHAHTAAARSHAHSTNRQHGDPHSRATAYF